MGLWDTFSRTFGFTTSDDDEQETGAGENEVDEEEDEEEEEEEDSGFSFFHFTTDFFRRKTAQQSSSRYRAYESEEDEEEEEDQTPPPKQKSARSNVIHDPRMSSQASSEPEYAHCERIVVVHQIEECREIIKCLLRGESVLLNLEDIDQKDCARVVDLLSGAAFALQGRMLKVAHLAYLLAPESVEVINGEPYPNAQARYR